MKTSQLFLFCVVIFSMSCKKDTLIENFTPKANNNPVVPQDSVSTYQSLQNFFIENGAPLQTFTINPAVYNTISGSKGGKIFIPANAFIDSLGNFPTGSISVLFREIYSVQDMILSNKPTVANGNILVSGGEIFFDATTTNGNSLKISPGQSINFNIPNANPQWGMQLYMGIEIDTIGLQWTLNDTALVNVDSSNTGYTFDIDYYTNIYWNNYNWMNCDYLWNNPNPKTNVTLNFTSNPQDTLNITAYLVFTSINSIYGLYSYTNYTAINIPETVTTTAVAIGVGVTSKKLYFAKTTLTVTTNLTTTLTLTPTTIGELKAALDGL